MAAIQMQSAMKLLSSGACSSSNVKLFEGSRKESHSRMTSGHRSNTCHPSASAEGVSGEVPESEHEVKEETLYRNLNHCSVWLLPAEPKWKQKLAAADAQAEKTRQLTAQAQEEYRSRQDVLRQQGEAGGAAARPLAELELMPYLSEDGSLSDCSQAGAKASVYAVFDEAKVLRYIGCSRQVNPSLRLHFARMPRQCWWVKVQHIAKPSRALLEGMRERWIEENGGKPDGNDNGPLQNQWENPLDCKPLMTEEERAKVEAAAPGPPTFKALKEVARRVEGELEAGYKDRKCTETLRFDPKLKEQGLLDLKNVAPPPDTAVPIQNAQETQVSSIA